MPPDLNSLPPSPSPTSPPLQQPASRTSTTEPSRNMSQSPSASPTPHTPPHSHSLAAAATMNAGIHNEELRRQSSGSMRREVERARRRSSIRMNLNLNDPSLPAPGELQMSPSTRTRSGQWPHSPHHERTPSLGELHQELEYEQETQVNRLLSMIREQQTQIQNLQASQPHHSNSAVDDSTTPTSERSMSLPRTTATPQNTIVSPIPNPVHRSNSPFTYNNQRGTISRQSSMAERSQGNSNTGSPALRPSSGHGPYENHEYLPGPAVHTRDESLFYQAETQMLTRENQMLKLRIRELGIETTLRAQPLQSSPNPALANHHLEPAHQHPGRESRPYTRARECTAF
ncbi:hypothetical protein K458DRAFT_443146 [Lentithecium fluviatile CBS 122367]|uniref:Uncharacterized protein n=1 Tax=Lentithecium fluviatile CBS 122367 TaxID=1168545 RepID=A0A6G1J1V4_9PLEO|nr:hypothetical protein K458DRAFT_443146 [Lentithecium fluviatile CBS 122367]